MRILFVCHRWPYPPKRGGKIRPFNILSHLSKSHEVTVASLVRSDDEADEGRDLEEHCHRVLMGHVREPFAWGRMIARMPTSIPSSMGYFYSPDLKRLIDEEAAKTEFDLIFVHCSSVAQYVEDLTGPKKVLDFGDMDSQKWLTYRRYHRFPKSLGYWLEGAKLEREEKRLAGRFDLCTCTTKQEHETLNSYQTGVETAWFPNGVDHEYFSPATEACEPGLISFIGRMDYYPNQQAMLEFCGEIFPLIRRRRPDAKLVIVGAEPSRNIQQLGQIDGVTVTGSVPDVRPFVSKSTVNVAPLGIARGTQNKIFEAMAMGVPVVTTPIAAAGIDAVAGEHFLSASGPEEFAVATVTLLDDEGARNRLAIAGRNRVLSNHDWSGSMRRLDGILFDHFGIES